MAGTRAAARYAKAVLELALERNKLQAVNSDMLHIASTLDGHEDLNNVLMSPVVNASDKKAILDQVFKAVDSLTSDLFNLLLTNNRLPILGSIAKVFTKLYNEHMGIQAVTVTTAVELSPDLQAQVLKKVKELTPHEVVIENVIDQSVIGGFVLRVGDLEYNASVSNQLNKLKKELTLN